jgi:hypothetical protein
MKDTFYIIEKPDLDALNIACSRLYRGDKLDIDTMRDIARDIENVIEHAQNCPIEEARLYRAALD